VSQSAAVSAVPAASDHSARSRCSCPCASSRDVTRAGLCGDAGVAAVLVLAMASVLVLVAAVTTSLAAVAVARQRAASAADLAALAAAQASLAGEAAACARAALVAERTAARLAECRLDGDVATVVAQVRPPGPLGRVGVASIGARAGPASQATP
jgi:secretion/DNA translocation related TadE-like protein